VEVDAKQLGADSRDDGVPVEHARYDRSAFAAIYVDHRETVFRYLRARCASDEDALELTAITFERALAAMPRFSPKGGGVPAWLLRIARNAHIDEGRRRGRLVTEGLTGERASEDPTPDEAAILADERRTLRRHLAALKEIERDALALRYGSGLTSREISSVIGKSEEATQKLLTRALAKLTEAMS
jgi:RNA polymerase sigma-70 factor (ECF subfamily)